MSQFSRRAKWLDFLFPASSLPRTKDPGDVSEDVSLVQLYDGGGVAVPPMEEWFFGPVLSGVGVAKTTAVLSVPVGKVYRLFGASCFTLQGIGPKVSLVVSQAAASGGVVLSRETVAPAVGNGSVNLIERPVVLPARSFLYVPHFDGDANSAISIVTYGAMSPAGSAFTC